MIIVQCVEYSYQICSFFTFWSVLILGEQRQVVIVVHGQSLLYPHFTPSGVLKADLLSCWQRLGDLDGSFVSGVCCNDCLP